MMDDYIAGIFVLKDYRAHGIGKQLLQKVQAEYEKLTLNVYKKIQLLLRFISKTALPSFLNNWILIPMKSKTPWSGIVDAALFPIPFFLPVS